MVVRQLGQPIDLFAAVPKTGVIQPGRYMDTLRQRFAPIAERTNIANELTQYKVMQAEAARRQAEYDAAMDARNRAMDDISNWSPARSIGQTAGRVLGAVSGNRYTGAYVNPVPGYSPSGKWGKYPVSGKQHRALDIPVPMNTRVGSPVTGTIVVAGWDSGGFGNSVRIQAANGAYWILGHLNSLNVKRGQKVTAGQLLGMSGSTGRSSGPHLHLEARTSLYNPSSAFNFSSLFGW